MSRVDFNGEWNSLKEIGALSSRVTTAAFVATGVAR